MLLEEDTRNFNIKVEDAEEEGDGDIRARIHAKPLGHEGEHYEEKIKITGRSAKQFAKTIKQMFDLEKDDIKKLKVEILGLKNKIRPQAKTQQEMQQEQNQEDLDRDRRQKKFNKVLETLMKAGGTLEEEAIESTLTNVDDVRKLVDDIDPTHDQILLEGTEKMSISEEGREQLKEHLGFETFDGDPKAEAQTQLKKGNPLQYYLDSFNKLHKGDHLLKVWEMISALSCSCADRQIHSWAVGPSGKGKSHLKRKLLEYLPAEMYERKESFSPKALQYKSTSKGPGFLNNKLVYFDEVGEDDVENAIELMRLMTDQDQDIVTHETVKDQEIMTINLDVSNITVWFTSVDTIEDEQLKNRFILTNPDASSAQDQTVFKHQQNILNAGGDLDFIPKETPVVQSMIRDIRENTPQYKPIIPFKINWKQEFNRRLYPFFYTLMGMIAKIHYKNRETKDGYIFVTESDFKLAKLIWSKLIDTTVAQTDEQSIELLKELPESQENALKRRELRNRLSGFTTRKVKETCDSLEETEELQLINSRYEDGEYEHWAGNDVKKLVDNEPEIKTLNEEVAVGMIKEAGVEPDEDILENILEAETQVYSFLKERVQEKKAVAEDNELPEITDQEEEMLKQFAEFEWGMDLNSFQQFEKDKDEDALDVHELAASLEEKDVIRIDGENKPHANATLDKLKGENEVQI